MSYSVRLETYNGSVKTISLPDKNSVNNFVNEYPKQLPKGISVKVSCDLLGIRGTLKGVK